MAIDIFKSRNQHKEITHNPMKIKEKQEEKIIDKKFEQDF